MTTAVEEQPRLTPEEVVEAYKANNLIPTRYSIRVTNNKRCCGLGAIYVQKTGRMTNDDEDTDPLYDFIRDRYGEAYTEGFTMGFDCADNSVSLEEQVSTFSRVSRRYIEGFEDGFNAHILVMKEGLVK